MNHTNATPEEINRARRNIYRAAVRAGYDHSTAEDMAQTGITRILFREHDEKCPATILRAASWEIAACRRWGWSKLLPRSQRPRGTAEEQARELATMAMHRQRAANLTPDELAAQADGWTEDQRAMAMRRAGAGSVLDAVLASQGVGPSACIHEAGHTPSIAGTRRRSPLPITGAQGLHTACDPVPGSHARAAAAVQAFNDAR